MSQLSSVKAGDRIAVYYGHNSTPELVGVVKTTKQHVVDVKGTKWRIANGSRVGEEGRWSRSHAAPVTQDVLNMLHYEALRKEALTLLRQIENGRGSSHGPRHPDVPIEVLEAIVKAGKAWLIDAKESAK